MNSQMEQDKSRRESAIDAAHSLMEADPSPAPKKIQDAAQECFDAGKPAAAKRLLDRFADRDEISKSPWFMRFRSWLDAVDAENWLATKQPFSPADTKPIQDLAERLRNTSQFGLSRRLLARLAGEREDLLAQPTANTDEEAAARIRLGDGYVKVIQKLALSTYKDLDLDPARALADAERLLDKIGLHAADCNDPETLGQGGAVYKRRSELTGRLEHLQQSLALYRKGWEAKDTKGNRLDEDAYCADNAAFVLDLLAKRIAGLNDRQATAWREEARVLREEFIAALEARENKSKWTHGSLADGYFALGKYAEARQNYADASKAMQGDWQRKTMFIQAVQLARAQGILLPDKNAKGDGIDEFEHPAWNALQPILGDKTKAALAGFRPKTGLALSGGGFRAAFYHLGVLAKLADIDALRHIEVISTVSGGSIVGTHYFLKLKALLEREGDDITAGNFQRLVLELIDEFRAGVASNLRMRAFASGRALWRMMYRLDYNRTLRLGELYDDSFFARILRKSTTTLRDLIVSPKGETRAFSPRQDNWLRRTKVPILLINATNLNSGHSWQFAGSFMGEPPGLLEAEIDANERYARIHFDDPNVPREWREFPLGTAVAASSAVPGLFNPVPLAGYYDERDVQLADGGIYDNQGVDTLLQENCSLILCSDASGQLDDNNSPSTLFLGVLKRTNNITMERDRIIEYQDLRSRLENRALDGLLFVHLRQGLDIRRVPPVCDKPDAVQPAAAVSAQTDYGIDKDIQRLLSQIRTDLDSFSEVEADALMLSGYLATGKQIEECQENLPPGERWGDFSTSAISHRDWPFLGMAASMCTDLKQDTTASARVNDVKEQLKASSELFAKLFRLDGCFAAKAQGVVTCLAVAAIAIAGIYGLVSIQSKWLPLGAPILATVIFATLMIRAGKLKWRLSLQRLGELAVALLILPVAAAGRWVFNSPYLARGTRKRLEQIN